MALASCCVGLVRGMWFSAYVGVDVDGVLLVRDVLGFGVDLAAGAQEGEGEVGVDAVALVGVVDADGMVGRGEGVLVDAQAELGGEVEQAEWRGGSWWSGGGHGVEFGGFLGLQDGCL